MPMIPPTPVPPASGPADSLLAGVGTEPFGGRGGHWWNEMLISLLEGLGDA